MKTALDLVFILTLVLPAVFCVDYNFTIKKCSCEWHQIQEQNGDCTDHNTTYVHVWDDEAQVGKDIHLGQIADIAVTPLVCSSGQQKVVVRGIALLSTRGQLLPSPELPTDAYCVENLLNADGSPAQRYEHCVRYQPFRLCCPVDETVNAVGECGPPQHRFPISFDYVVENVQCVGESPAAHQPIFIPGDDLIALKDISGYYGNHRDNNSCLMAHQLDGEIYYFRRYCQCDGVTCIEQCCSPAESFNVGSATCEPSSDTYAPTNLIFPEANIIPIARTTGCNESYVLDFNTSEYSILNDGSLVSETGTVPAHSFCLGLVTVDGSVTLSSGLGCFAARPEPVCVWRFTIVQVCLAVSSVFIALTIVAYLAVKDLRNRTAGACLISELVAMLVSQVNLIVIQRHQGNFSPSGCLVAGVIEIIFVLSTFFWLNVICFDMWTTFRSLRSYSPKLFNTKLFLKFSLYAWGLPVLIGLSVVAVELIDVHPRPNFTPYRGCFFSSSADDRIAQWIYLYSFILLLLLVNLIFFLNVIIKILSLQKEQRKFQARGSRRNDQQNANLEATKLYGSLFILMGLPWLIEVFSSFAMETDECYIWVLDIVNLLRGVLIFYIFVLKKSNRLKIMRALFSSGPTNDSSDGSRKTSMMILSNWLSSRKTPSSVAVSNMANK